MKKEFEKVKIEIVSFRSEDVVRTSGEMTTNGLYEDKDIDVFFGN